MTEVHLPDDILDLLTGYALEALDDEEMLHAQQVLAERPDLHAFVQELRTTLDQLPHALPESLPAPALRQRSLDYAIHGRKPQSPLTSQEQPNPLRRWITLLGGLAGAATLICILAWVQLSGLQRDLAQTQVALQQAQQQALDLQNRLTQAQADQQQAQSSADALQQELSQVQTQLEEERKNQAQIVAVLAGKNTTIALRGPGGTGTALRTEHNAVMIAAQLPPLPTGRTYQLWLIHDKVPVGAGTFQVDQSGHGTIMLAEGTPQADAYAITEEPDGGSPGPTTAPVLTGEGITAQSIPTP